MSEPSSNPSNPLDVQRTAAGQQQQGHHLQGNSQTLSVVTNANAAAILAHQQNSAAAAAAAAAAQHQSLQHFAAAQQQPRTPTPLSASNMMATMGHGSSVNSAGGLLVQVAGSASSSGSLNSPTTPGTGGMGGMGMGGQGGGGSISAHNQRTRGGQFDPIWDEFLRSDESNVKTKRHTATCKHCAERLEGRVEFLYRHICDKCSKVPIDVRSRWKTIQNERQKRDEKRKAMLTMSGEYDSPMGKRAKLEKRDSKTPRYEPGPFSDHASYQISNWNSIPYSGLPESGIGPSALGTMKTAVPPRRSPITTHVLDTTIGMPAVGVEVALHILEAAPTPLGASWNVITVSRTDADGRCGDLIPVVEGVRAGLVAGAVYKLTFGIEEYFKRQNKEAFFPVAEIQFRVSNPAAPHYHIPLLLSGYSYSTYRGT
ncbi:hypothetical protein HDU97_007389 [Phlyctochytrium planicorne]|nr:hypothetical protein HDU97_007389 [Phlyctochytrium planicorne]